MWRHGGERERSVLGDTKFMKGDDALCPFSFCPLIAS